MRSRRPSAAGPTTRRRMAPCGHFRSTSAPHPVATPAPVAAARWGVARRALRVARRASRVARRASRVARRASRVGVGGVRVARSAPPSLPVARCVRVRIASRLRDRPSAFPLRPLFRSSAGCAASQPARLRAAETGPCPRFPQKDRTSIWPDTPTQWRFRGPRVQSRRAYSTENPLGSRAPPSELSRSGLTPRAPRGQSPTRGQPARLAPRRGGAAAPCTLGAALAGTGSTWWPAAGRSSGRARLDGGVLAGPAAGGPTWPAPAAGLPGCLAAWPVRAAWPPTAPTRDRREGGGLPRALRALGRPILAIILIIAINSYTRIELAIHSYV